MIKCLLPIKLYWTTRKHKILKLGIALIPSILFLLYTIFKDINTCFSLVSLYQNSINIQITALAILLSFSIAIMTIFITSSSPNVEKIKGIKTNNKYKPYVKIKRKGNIEMPGDKIYINLYQVILTAITVDIYLQVGLLLFLFMQYFILTIIPQSTFKYFIAIDIFIIVIIFCILIECVVNMFLTFWKPLGKDKDK